MDHQFEEGLFNRHPKVALTLEEVAAELGVDVADVEAVVVSGELAVKHVGSKVIVPLISFAEYLGESLPNTTSQMATPELTSTNSTITLVKDDVDMTQGCVTYVKKSDRYLYQLDLGKTPDGKRIRESKSFLSETEAKAALDIRLAQLGQSGQSQNIRNTVVSPTAKVSGNTSLQRYLNYYLSLGLGKATSRTLQGYYYSAEKVTNELGDFSLQELTTELLAKFFNELKKKYAQSTLNKIYVVLKMSLRYATKKKLIPENPLEDISRPKSQVVREDDYKAYTQEEEAEIIAKAITHSEVYPLLMVLKYTGMRPGELRALRWDNVDFENKTIRITQAATIEYIDQGIGKKPLKKEFIGPTKSVFGVRTLSVPDEVLDAIKSWRKFVESSKQYKYARDSEFLFCAKSGSFILENALRLRFKRLLESEELNGKGYTLYRFRHTVCTNLIKSGVDIPTVQRIMGDNTTDVILKVYTHVNNEDTKKALEKLYK